MTDDMGVLMSNLDPRHADFLRTVAIKVAEIQAQRFTGKTVITINSKEGTCADVEMQVTTRMWSTAGRRMRSSGI